MRGCDCQHFPPVSMIGFAADRYGQHPTRRRLRYGGVHRQVVSGMADDWVGAPCRRAPGQTGRMRELSGSPPLSATVDAPRSTSRKPLPSSATACSRFTAVPSPLSDVGSSGRVRQRYGCRMSAPHPNTLDVIETHHYATLIITIMKLGTSIAILK